MKRIAVSFVVILACIVFVSCGVEPTSGEIITYYNAAEKLIEDGDFDSAQKLINEAISFFGESELLNSLVLKMERSIDLQSETQTAIDTNETLTEPEYITEISTTMLEKASMAESETTIFATTKEENESKQLATATTSKAAKSTDGYMLPMPTQNQRKSNSQQTTPIPSTQTNSQAPTAPTTQTKPVTTTAPTTQKSSQEKAIDLAKSYLQQTTFSKSQIINQIQRQGFSETDAVYAVDRCGADWENQAVKAAQKLASDSNGYSYEGMKNQLQTNGFTESEASFAVDRAGIDWNEQAVKEATSHTRRAKYSSSYTWGFSFESLVRQLEYSKFTHEQAVYGASNCGADWNEQAVISAKAIIHSEPNITDEELYKKMIGESFSLYGGSFTPDEARYAVAHCR